MRLEFDPGLFKGRKISAYIDIELCVSDKNDMLCVPFGLLIAQHD